MLSKHLNTLEFPKILERLAKHTIFSASNALALALQPSPYFSEVQARHAETTEAARLLAAKPNTSVRGAHDVRPLLERLKRGAILTPLELLEVRQTLIVARELQRTLTRLEEAYPRLADMAGRVEECPGVVNAIGQAIDERGEVKNNASPALAKIRREIETAHSRLLEKLQRLISSSQNQRYLQEFLFTQRQGRYVIPLKADFKGRIQGIIHDQSASGATLFIEPLTTVDLNNRWRQAQLEEEEEIRRILVELSDTVREQAPLITHTVEALADFDLALAKAKYAEAIEAVEPILLDLKKYPAVSSPDDSGAETEAPPFFDLIAARHPLLDPETVVPVDITLSRETKMLVITGPNTGGKTVSLKTAGLLTAMAQAGLRLPVLEGSTVPVFNNIFADIGDEQSIEQSLSTFSSHMTNIVKILAECDPQSLVIFDELGAGTDPVEGSALARSILSQLLERGVTTLVATHYSELKAYAHTTPGVMNASMEFDVESLAPTYRLQIGLPGASNAFAIAQRLGLPQPIINQAQGLIGENVQQVEAMLAEIKTQKEIAEQIRREAEQERAEVEAQQQRLDRRLADIDQERREILSSVRADARREIKAVREEIRALKEQAQADIKQWQAKARNANEAEPQVTPVPAADTEAIETKLDSVESGVKAKAAPPPPPQKKPSSVRPGDRVFISQFNTVGEVVDIQNKQVEVQLGNFRATVELSDLEVRQKAEAQKQKMPQSTVSVPTAESPGLELDLRGQIAEEAILRLDQYLDQAFMAQLPWVRIIHGKGSGTLRQVVRQELSTHPMISSYRPGGANEGGDGVTVAKLAVG